MTKKFVMLVGILLLTSSLLCAQTPGFNTPGGHWVPVSGAFAMAIASSLCGLAQGKAIASAVEGMPWPASRRSRSPPSLRRRRSCTDPNPSLR